eukprot:1469532-Rhodomonas_salina.1
MERDKAELGAQDVDKLPMRSRDRTVFSKIDEWDAERRRLRRGGRGQVVERVVAEAAVVAFFVDKARGAGVGVLAQPSERRHAVVVDHTHGQRRRRAPDTVSVSAGTRPVEREVGEKANQVLDLLPLVHNRLPGIERLVQQLRVVAVPAEQRGVDQFHVHLLAVGLERNTLDHDGEGDGGRRRRLLLRTREGDPRGPHPQVAAELLPLVVEPQTLLRDERVLVGGVRDGRVKAVCRCLAPPEHAPDNDKVLPVPAVWVGLALFEAAVRVATEPVEQVVGARLTRIRPAVCRRALPPRPLQVRDHDLCLIGFAQA